MVFLEPHNTLHIRFKHYDPVYLSEPDLELEFRTGDPTIPPKLEITDFGRLFVVIDLEWPLTGRGLPSLGLLRWMSFITLGTW